MDLLHQDRLADKVFAELPAVLQRYPGLLCSIRKAIPGIPCFEPEYQMTDERGYTTVSPWGPVRKLTGSDLGTYDLYHFDLFRLYDEPTSPLAPPQMPQRGHAVVDVLTSIVTVFAQNGQPEPEPVYHSRVTLEEQRGRDILSAIRAELAQAGVPVYPNELYGESSIPYPWEDAGSFSNPRVHNDEVSVPLVGYALDPDTQEVIYLHVVGAKTALRSIWGTLSNGGVQRVSISGERHISGYSSHDYETFSSPVDADTNLYRLVIADRRATGQEVEERAYLVIPKGESEGLDPGEVFAARLNALLPIPVLPRWGTTLRRCGSDEELLQVCICGGDVEKAYLITKDGWVELVESLIQGGELSIAAETE